MADRRCAMCGFPISAENECNVSCGGPCQRVFHISCVVGSTIWSPSVKHWKCCSCKSLATSELASSALKSAFLPVKNSVDSPQTLPENARKPQKPRGTESPNTENLSNAVEFLGGQIDIFNKIVVKFKKRMDEFEKLNRELKNENEELKIEVQALRKRVEAVENDQIFGQCHLNSSTDEMNFSSGSFDIPEIAPGIFVLPESAVDGLEMVQVENPVLEGNDKEKLKVKFEIPESSSPLGFHDDPGSEPTVEATPELVPGYFVLADSIQEILAPEKALKSEPSDAKMKVRFELPPPSPLGFDAGEAAGTPEIVNESMSTPTIVVVPNVVERKLRSALKPARKHFGNVVVRLMAEEYLSGKK